MLRRLLETLALLIAANGCVTKKIADPGTAATAVDASRMAPIAAELPPNRMPPTAATLPFDFSRVAFFGRVAFGPTGQAQYAWSGAGFLARFRGRGLAVQMSDAGNHHTVVIDGTLAPKLVTQLGQRRYTIVENLEPGEHQVELYRRTEALFGATTLTSVEAIDGDLLPMKDLPVRHIEIVGDSITCGYGNEGADAHCGFSAETENHYLSYGARLARHFGATLSTIAWSGRGVVKNYNGESGDLMPALYNRTLPQLAETAQDRRIPADLVIINLGTNDFSTEPDPADTIFVGAYEALIAEVRRQSPNAYVLATIGPMLSGQDLQRAERCILEAVKHRKLAGDQRVGYHKMLTRNDKPGCDSHPSIRTHELMEKELVEPIARALGW